MSECKIYTRSTVPNKRTFNVLLFGTVTYLDPEITNVLPTVLQCFESVRLQSKGQECKEPPSIAIASAVAEKLKIMWRSASLLIMTHKSIVDMILSYHSKYKIIIEPVKSRETPFFFMHECFFCSSKCATFHECKCPRERKVPEIDWPFIIDQRNDRKMAIVIIDRV